MSKHLQAYFRSEDEAESAKTTLLTYKTDQLEVSELQETVGRGANILVPLIPWSGAGSGGVTSGSGTVGNPSGAGAVVGVQGVPADNHRSEDEPVTEDDHDRDEWKDADLDDADFDDLKYVLTAKVNDADYESIVRKLRSNHAFIERFDE
ncbi:hypothetical protein [Paenibacillus lemnae]|uniref:Uncharacterized protein n=1 Tax=Paenibacillus lemnae TaxID=1330551 RepID=A0A848MA25_PAELE|nr:hypothetical protein [Paenibacillus lemnae]NMO96763.1 hypothetical protein [Paenibacillus lemnae]